MTDHEPHPDQPAPAPDRGVDAPAPGDARSDQPEPMPAAGGWAPQRTWGQTAAPWQPVPAWQPPPVPPRPAARRVALVVGALMLALGIAAGAGIAAAVSRGSQVSGAATVQVDNRPVAAASGNGAAGDAVSVAQQLGPAVGTIINRNGNQSALGSGFVIAHNGDISFVLTNNHVVAGAKDLYLLMPDGRNLQASVVGTDSLDDLAVISVKDGSLKMATFGDSSQLHAGQAVIAIGSPLGNEGSVTRGVVSALHRTIQAGSDASSPAETLQDVLQTDASINRGNSGGPLADTSGRVVGVNVAIAGNASNIGFSIPSNLARSVAEQLIQHQRVQHPFLGISYLTSIDAFEEGRGFNGAGVLVDKVSAGSPADKAGMHGGDIVQAVDGTSIDNGETLGGLIQKHRVGDPVAFTVRRGDQSLQLTATLVDRPAGT